MCRSRVGDSVTQRQPTRYPTDHLVAGAVYGLTLAIIAIAVPRFTRQILAAALIVAAMSYVGFAVETHASAAWLATELAGVGIFGYSALRGTRAAGPGQPLEQ